MKLESSAYYSTKKLDIPIIVEDNTLEIQTSQKP